MKTNDSEEMRSSYDFSHGVRGKHRQILRKGYTVTIYNEDGTKTIKQYAHEQSKTDWDRLENISDDEIDLSDIPELTEEDFKRMRPSKEVLAERGIKFDPNEPVMITEHHEDGTSTTYILPPPNERIS